MVNLVEKLITVFFGAADGILYAMVLFIILDYATGICVAVHKRRLSSDIGAKGIAKKVAIFVLVSMSHIADQYLMNSSNVLRTVTATFYLANEGISIIENVGKIGLPLPKKILKLMEYFDKLKN